MPTGAKDLAGHCTTKASITAWPGGNFLQQEPRLAMDGQDYPRDN